MLYLFARVSGSIEQCIHGNAHQTNHYCLPNPLLQHWSQSALSNKEFWEAPSRMVSYAEAQLPVSGHCCLHYRSIMRIVDDLITQYATNPPPQGHVGEANTQTSKIIGHQVSTWPQQEQNSYLHRKTLVSSLHIILWGKLGVHYGMKTILWCYVELTAY